MRTSRIAPRSKTVWKRDNTPGGPHHEWSEQVPLKGFEVTGGLFGTTNCATLEKAEKEKALRDGINKRFPFKMPRSERERRYIKRMGLTLDEKTGEVLQPGETA